jgi:hypothetical protein
MVDSPTKCNNLEAELVDDDFFANMVQKKPVVETESISKEFEQKCTLNEKPKVHTNDLIYASIQQTYHPKNTLNF